MIFGILKRYIVKTILLAAFLVVCSFVGIIFLVTLLTELKDLAGDYGLAQAIFYVLLRMPNVLYQFSPMLILLGCMLGLGMLSSHREIAVMRASGFSLRQIIGGVFLGAGVLIVLVTCLGEWVSPPLSYQAAVRKENATHSGQAVVTSSGVWYHIGDNFIHINQVIDRQLLEGVTRYQFGDGHRLTAAYYAKSLSLQNGQWVMRDMVETLFFPEQTKSQHLSEVPWDLKFNPNLLNIGLVEPNEMSLSRLLKFSRYLSKNGLQASAYQFEFWQRLLQPLACLMMVLLAIPFVLGAEPNVTMGWRMLVGILVGFIFYVLDSFFSQLCVVFQFPPLIAALLPLFIFMMISIFLMKRLVR